MQESTSSVRYLVRRFVARRSGAFLGGLVLLLLGLTLQRVPAFVVGVALDALLLDARPFALPLLPADLTPETTGGRTALLLAVLAVAVVGESAAKWYGGLRYAEASLRALHEIRVAAVDAALSLSTAFHDGSEDADVLGTLVDDASNLRALFVGTRDGVRYGGEIVTAFAFMLLLHHELALLLAALPALIAATGRVYARLLEPRYDAVRGSVGAVNVRLAGAVGGIRTVKAFTREATERERVAAASADYRDAKWSALRLRAVYNRVSWPLAAVGIWGLFALGSYWILAGPPLWFSEPLTPGTLLTFILFSFAVLDPTRRLAVDVIDRYESAAASSRRVVSLLRSDQRIDERPDAPDLAVEAGAVEYDGVSFAYSGADTPAIDDVSLSVDGGAFVGVVGPTGAGKSTLLKLLFRLYDPDAGTVRIDGRDVSAVTLSSLRRGVGYVSQDPFLFPGTVAENVAYAEADPDREAVVDAARLAGADEFVRTLPDGYDTEVGERGASLSGGQRQRLALARALFVDPPILVLDEATSHVDNETGAEIRRCLRAMAGDRTVFAVAHRLSTVRDADRILVVEDGRLVEDGCHEDLVATGGTYARLWRTQIGAVTAADGGGGEKTAPRDTDDAREAGR
ncbi:ABC transporter ATP-binding protein [Halobium salinum]|uniref:ABC transporter ATP-binding protein n=1 Tax=Halobium salinum TaxID=1364940 RepID=A0ABD5PFC1_9EURY|nr:ABC transporter ATP-binding protein [Halobium salinum]